MTSTPPPSPPSPAGLSISAGLGFFQDFENEQAGEERSPAAALSHPTPNSSSPPLSPVLRSLPCTPSTTCFHQEDLIGLGHNRRGGLGLSLVVLKAIIEAFTSPVRLKSHSVDI